MTMGAGIRMGGEMYGNKQFVIYRVHYFDERPNQLGVDLFNLNLRNAFIEAADLSYLRELSGSFMESFRKSREEVIKEGRQETRLASLARMCYNGSYRLNKGDKTTSIITQIIEGVEERLPVDDQTLWRFRHRMLLLAEEDKNKTAP